MSRIRMPVRKRPEIGPPQTPHPSALRPRLCLQRPDVRELSTVSRRRVQCDRGDCRGEALSSSNQTKAQRWVVEFAGGSLIVQAPDQWGAWDALRDRRLEDFGLICSAEPNENGDPFLVQTETLMRRWGRETDADLCHEAAVKEGLIASDKRANP